MAKPDKKEQIKRVEEFADYLSKFVVMKCRAGEGVMMTLHVIKDGKISHYCNNYQDFPLGDWGPCLIEIGVAARMARLNQATGQAKSE